MKIHPPRGGKGETNSQPFKMVFRKGEVSPPCRRGMFRSSHEEEGKQSESQEYAVEEKKRNGFMTADGKDSFHGKNSFPYYPM
ncbi:hypothetical protein CULT_170060 [[Clostridium] ultunense Esp]|nr:hypothetical protein CULT_170060 [[Clostridium] ultunense Esp]